jgi:hypothetical protein
VRASYPAGRQGDPSTGSEPRASRPRRRSSASRPAPMLVLEPLCRHNVMAWARVGGAGSRATPTSAISPIGVQGQSHKSPTSRDRPTSLAATSSHGVPHVFDHAPRGSCLRRADVPLDARCPLPGTGRASSMSPSVHMTRRARTKAGNLRDPIVAVQLVGTRFDAFPHVIRADSPPGRPRARGRMSTRPDVPCGKNAGPPGLWPWSPPFPTPDSKGRLGGPPTGDACAALEPSRPAGGARAPAGARRRHRSSRGSKGTESPKWEEWGTTPTLGCRSTP